MNYLIRYGQSVSDVVMSTYGDLSYTYKLLLDNPQISDVTADLSLLQNKTIVWTPVNKPAPIILTANPPAAAPKVSTYYSRDGQNIHDICLQVYQDLGMIYKLIQDNNWQDIDTYPSVGTPFTYLVKMGSDDIFSSYIAKNNIHINTGNYTIASVQGRARITSDGELRQTSNGDIRIVS